MGRRPGTTSAGQSTTAVASGASSSSRLRRPGRRAEPRAAEPGLTIRDVAGRIAVGGWPGLQGWTVDAAQTALRAAGRCARRVCRRLVPLPNSPRGTGSRARSDADARLAGSLATAASGSAYQRRDGEHSPGRHRQGSRHRHDRPRGAVLAGRVAAFFAARTRSLASGAPTIRLVSDQMEEANATDRCV